MKKLTKLTAILMAAVLLFTVALPVVADAAEYLAAEPDVPKFYNFATAEKEVAVFDFDDLMLPPSAEFLSATANKPPATIPATYVLADGVVELKSNSNAVARNAIRSIASAEMLMSGSAQQVLSPGRIIQSGGFIEKEVLEAVSGEIKPGTVTHIIRQNTL